MELQEIEVFIEKDGKVCIEVRGVKGEACLEITSGLEQALGGQIESREMTPEVYEKAIEQVQEKEWLRGSR